MTNGIKKISSLTNNTSNREESILNYLKEVLKNNFWHDNRSRRDYKFRRDLIII